MRVKLQAIKQELRGRMHQQIPEQGTWLRQIVIGYFNYHAVPTNGPTLSAFRSTLPTYGNARFGSEARRIGRPRNGSRGWPTTGSHDRESFTPGRMRALPSHTRGGRSYGAGGGGRGIFIVHTN